MNLIDFIAKRNNLHFRTDIVITSHNVYYVNSKVGEVMENEFNFESDIKKLRDAVDILEKMSPFVFDESILTAIYSSKANLKCLIYDLEDCVVCD